MAPPTPKAHEQTYLAKDYDSFRALLIEKLTAEVPDWTERSPADLTIAVLEVMAYAGDYLSYYQDVVGAEAYLATARRRTSLRRHARLLDYPIDDGANARAWVRFETTAHSYLLKQRSATLTGGPGAPVRIGDDAFAAYDGVVFETMKDHHLRRDHNRMAFRDNAAMAPDTTDGLLIGAYPHLEVGDVLALHLEGLDGTTPPKLIRLTQPPEIETDSDGPATRLSWRTDQPTGAPPVPAIDPGGFRGRCVAEGNFVLCDHGRTRREVLEPVPTTGPFAPKLTATTLGHAGAYPPVTDGPFGALAHDPRRAVAAVTLVEKITANKTVCAAYPPRIWRARRDLTASLPGSRDFVVEVETDGASTLRFGDGVFGRAPPPRARFHAYYREGAGDAGNVGPGALNQLVGLDAPVLSVTNPFPAAGGTSRETAANIRLSAPTAMRQRARCVTLEDYGDAARQAPDVHSATARRDGDVVEIFIKRVDGAPVDQAFRAEVTALIAPQRLIGDRLDVQAAAGRKLAARCHVRGARGPVADADLDVIRVAMRALVDALPIAGAVSPADLAAVARASAAVSKVAVALFEHGERIEWAQASDVEFFALTDVDFIKSEDAGA